MLKNWSLWLLIFSILGLDLLFFLTIANSTFLLTLTVIEVLTLSIGFWILRPLDFQVLFFIDTETEKGTKIVKELWDEWLQILSGILLILPGIITNFLGVLLSFPPIRRWLIQKVLKGI